MKTISAQTIRNARKKMAWCCKGSRGPEGEEEVYYNFSVYVCFALCTPTWFLTLPKNRNKNKQELAATGTQGILLCIVLLNDFPNMKLL